MASLRNPVSSNGVPVLFLLIVLFLVYLNNGRKLQAIKKVLRDPNATPSAPGKSSGAVGTSDVAKAATREAGVPESWANNPALWELVKRESGTTPTDLKSKAQNPKSTAYGIFQFLDKTWKDYKYPKTSDPYRQFVNGYAYIKQRYGTPERALAFQKANGWY